MMGVVQPHLAQGHRRFSQKHVSESVVGLQPDTVRLTLYAAKRLRAAKTREGESHERQHHHFASFLPEGRHRRRRCQCARHGLGCPGRRGCGRPQRRSRDLGRRDRRCRHGLWLCRPGFCHFGCCRGLQGASFREGPRGVRRRQQLRVLWLLQHRDGRGLCRVLEGPG